VILVLLRRRKKQMAYLAYIIGEIPDRITVKCRHKFENAKFLLEKKGFKVINPIDNLVNKKLKIQDAKKINFRQLLNCNVAYILPSVSFEMGKNAELLLAIKLDMLIIQDSVFLNEDVQIEELEFINV
jgi:hypothetical protein